MPICFKTLKNPDVYYNSANIVFITPEGNRNKLVIKSDDLSVELVVKTQNILKCDPSITDITLDYNAKFQTAVVTYKSPELNYIRNVSRIISIKLDNELSPRKLNFNSDHFDVIDNDKKENKKITPDDTMHCILQLLSKAHCENKNPMDVIVGMHLQREKERLDKDFKSKLEGVQRCREVIDEIHKEKDYKIRKQTVDLGNLSTNIHSDLHPALNNEELYRYTLIYKLKEREDYKEVKKRFDHHKHNDVLDYVELVYDHKDDKFYLLFNQIFESNYTVLDVWKKKK